MNIRSALDPRHILVIENNYLVTVLGTDEPITTSIQCWNLNNLIRVERLESSSANSATWYLVRLVFLDDEELLVQANKLGESELLRVMQSNTMLDRRFAPQTVIYRKMNLKDIERTIHARQNQLYSQRRRKYNRVANGFRFIMLLIMAFGMHKTYTVFGLFIFIIFWGFVGYRWLKAEKDYSEMLRDIMPTPSNVLSPAEYEFYEIVKFDADVKNELMTLTA